ncbi:MarR family protein [uncultured archaeon]|nr:MarR family protein [uncultured archaeon]
MKCQTRVQTTTDNSLVRLRKSMALMNMAMNRVLGIDRGKKSELSPMTLSILYLCYFKRIKMNEIAEIFNISKSTTTDYVDHLESKGFVCRRKGESDRREIHIFTTPKGSDLILNKEERTNSFLKECLSRLTDEEQAQFISLLFKFAGNDDSLPYETLIEDLMKRPFSEKPEASAMERDCKDRSPAIFRACKSRQSKDAKTN